METLSMVFGPTFVEARTPTQAQCALKLPLPPDLRHAGLQLHRTFPQDLLLVALTCNLALGKFH